MTSQKQSGARSNPAVQVRTIAAGVERTSKDFPMGPCCHGPLIHSGMVCAMGPHSDVVYHCIGGFQIRVVTVRRR